MYIIEVPILIKLYFDCYFIIKFSIFNKLILCTF